MTHPLEMVKTKGQYRHGIGLGLTQAHGDIKTATPHIQTTRHILAQLDFKNLLNLDKAFRPRDDADWEFLRAAAQNLFRPKAPIEDDKLFQGRLKQVSDVLDVIYEDGAHAVIFGERGVGKTSLANIIEKRVIPMFSALACINV